MVPDSRWDRSCVQHETPCDYLCCLFFATFLPRRAVVIPAREVACLEEMCSPFSRYPVRDVIPRVGQLMQQAAPGLRSVALALMDLHELADDSQHALTVAAGLIVVVEDDPQGGQLNSSGVEPAQSPSCILELSCRAGRD